MCTDKRQSSNAAINLGRLVHSITCDEEDITYCMQSSILFILGELCAGILVACVPTLGPVFFRDRFAPKAEAHLPYSNRPLHKSPYTTLGEDDIALEPASQWERQWNEFRDEYREIMGGALSRPSLLEWNSNRTTAQNFPPLPPNPIECSLSAKCASYRLRPVSLRAKRTDAKFASFRCANRSATTLIYAFSVIWDAPPCIALLAVNRGIKEEAQGLCEKHMGIQTRMISFRMDNRIQIYPVLLKTLLPPKNVLWDVWLRSHPQWCYEDDALHTGLDWRPKEYNWSTTMQWEDAAMTSVKLGSNQFESHVSWNWNPTTFYLLL